MYEKRIVYGYRPLRIAVNHRQIYDVASHAFETDTPPVAALAPINGNPLLIIEYREVNGFVSRLSLRDFERQVVYAGIALRNIFDEDILQRFG